MRLTLRDLIGLNLWTCRRAADMAMFHFGKRRQTLDFYGRSTEVGEYALHVQCGWRIVGGNAIKIGSRDLYYPEGLPDGELAPSGFDWDKGPNRRDALLKALFEEKRELTVREVIVGAAGFYRLEFDQVSLELFPDDSSSEEHWRLFATAEGGPETIVSGKSLRSTQP